MGSPGRPESPETRGERLARIARLLDKYRELARLAAQRQEWQAAGLTRLPIEMESQRREAFRALASAFPGALRELDSLSPDALARRLRSIEVYHATCLQQDPQESLPDPPDDCAWIWFVADYHDAMRAALAVKAWLATNVSRAQGITPDAVARWCEAHPQRQLDSQALHDHLHPPGGRVDGLVWAALEEKHQRTRRQLKREIFGDPDVAD